MHYTSLSDKVHNLDPVNVRIRYERQIGDALSRREERVTEHGRWPDTRPVGEFGNRGQRRESRTDRRDGR